MLNMHPIFDFHVRLVPRPGAADRLIGAMDAHGVARAAVCAGGTISLGLLSRHLVEGGHVESDAANDAVLTACSGADGRLVPFFFANPHADAGLYLKAAGQFRGVEISPAVHGVALCDNRTRALVDIAERAGHPVYVVCLDRPGCRVTDLVRLAGLYPAVRFVLGHAGVGNIDYYGVDLIVPQDNIWLETSGGYSSVAQAAIERLGSDRVVFGSEYPLQHHSVELTKIRSLDLNPDSWHRVVWGNARQLIGVDAT